MLFGEDSLKGLKKELKLIGADMSMVKSWQKVYDKVRKNSVQIEAQYTGETRLRTGTRDSEKDGRNFDCQSGKIERL